MPSLCVAESGKHRFGALLISLSIMGLVILVGCVASLHLRKDNLPDRAVQTCEDQSAEENRRLLVRLGELKKAVKKLQALV